MVALLAIAAPLEAAAAGAKGKQRKACRARVWEQAEFRDLPKKAIVLESGRVYETGDARSRSWRDSRSRGGGLRRLHAAERVRRGSALIEEPESGLGPSVGWGARFGLWPLWPRSKRLERPAAEVPLRRSLSSAAWAAFPPLYRRVGRRRRLDRPFRFSDFDGA
jgi:hypothetical protein